MQDRGATAVVKDTGTTPTDAKIADALAAAGDADLTVVLTNKAWDTEVTDKQAKQQKLVNALLDTGRPVIVIPVRDPYDVAYFPAAPTTLVTYGTAAVSMEALAKVLYGEIAPAGKLPVAIPAQPDPAQTLHPFGHGLTFDPRQTRITVASYNIHAGAGEDNVFDLDRTAQALKALDADVIGLQEVDVHWDARSEWRDTIAELADEARDVRRVLRPDLRLRPAGRRATAPAVRRRRTVPVPAGADREPSDHPAVHPGPESGARPAPGFLEAEIDVRGRRVHVYCTHLDYRADPSVRALQVGDTTARFWPRTLARTCRSWSATSTRIRPRRSSPGCGPGSPIPGPSPGPPPAVRTPIRRSIRSSGSTSSPSARACACGGSPYPRSLPPVTTVPWSPT